MSSEASGQQSRNLKGEGYIRHKGMFIPIVQVATGLIFHPTKPYTVLIAQRLPHVPLGGLWEFPGGKIESGETVHAALIRELQEEVGITVQEAEPWFSVQHVYGADKMMPQRCIRVELWQVWRFSGEALSCEGQTIQWAHVNTLREHPFLEANTVVIEALERI